VVKLDSLGTEGIYIRRNGKKTCVTAGIELTYGTATALHNRLGHPGSAVEVSQHVYLTTVTAEAPKVWNE
jgi:hypothetical protein